MIFLKSDFAHPLPKNELYQPLEDSLRDGLA
jgi:hypothetical protein